MSFDSDPRTSAPGPSTSGATSDLDVIGPAEWSDLVAAATGSDRAEIVDWRGDRIYTGLGAGTRLYRVTGTAAVGSPGSVEWTMIVKFFTLDVASYQQVSQRPSDWNYWKREWWAYQAPWLRGRRGPLVAPRCLGHSLDLESGGGQPIAWVALEDLGEPAPSWTTTQFRAVAEQVGSFNGRHPDGSFGDEPWLARDWLRGWTEQSSTVIDRLAADFDEPEAQRLFPAEVRDDLLRLWADRAQFFHLLDRLPATLVHNDVFPRNVFPGAGPEDPCVAVDWAFVGSAPVGAELAAMVGAGQASGGSSIQDWEDLERECLAGYLRGLRSAGHPADPDEVEAGYLLSYVLRFGVGVVPLTLSIATTPVSGRTELSRAVGPYDPLIDRLEAVAWFRQSRIRRAHALLGG